MSDLIFKQRKEIKRMKKIILYIGVAKFVEQRNNNIKKQSNMLDYQDYDEENIKDVTITKCGIKCSFNVYMAKDTYGHSDLRINN